MIPTAAPVCDPELAGWVIGNPVVAMAPKSLKVEIYSITEMFGKINIISISFTSEQERLN